MMGLNVNSLKQLQVDFVAALLAGKKNSVNFETGFRIYHNNFLERAVQTLKDHYPVAAAIVGEQEFRSLSIGYIHAYPSNFFSLNDFGDQFSHFVQEQFIDQKTPFLAELVDLEWIIHRVLLAEENKAFDFQKFSKIPDNQREKIIFHLAENGRLRRFSYPVHQIWESHQGQPAAGHSYAIWLQRKNYLLSITELDSLKQECIGYFEENLNLQAIYKKINQKFKKEGPSIVAQKTQDFEKTVPLLIEMGIISHFT